VRCRFRIGCDERFDTAVGVLDRVAFKDSCF
jgi:hypothetical protein